VATEFTPVKVKGLPVTTLKGVGTVTVPETVPPAVLVTVTVRSAVLPTFTAPKSSVPDGVTVTLLLAATRDVAGEQALSLPTESSAVIATEYDVPPARLERR